MSGCQRAAQPGGAGLARSRRSEAAHRKPGGGYRRKKGRGQSDTDFAHSSPIRCKTSVTVRAQAKVRAARSSHCDDRPFQLITPSRKVSGPQIVRLPKKRWQGRSRICPAAASLRSFLAEVTHAILNVALKCRLVPTGKQPRGVRVLHLCGQ
jgi:hypothetical protein